MIREKPTVSLGLPVFNGERFLDEAIRSLLAQTYEDFELIIRDNGSTDGTEAICRRYADRDPRVKYVRSDRNLGAAINYNRCFELSSGTYFKWCAHDDVCAPSYLERCVAVLDRHPEVVLAYPRTVIIDEFGREVSEYADNIDLRSERPAERLRALLARGPLECNAVFGLIRSDVLRRTPLIGRYAASDENLLGELALRGQIWQVPEPLFFRRDHPQTSLRANASLKERERWFDPSWRGRIYLPCWRWLIEYVRSSRRVPLRAGERLRVYAVLLGWAYRRKRSLIGNLVLLVVPREWIEGLLGRRPGPVRP